MVPTAMRRWTTLVPVLSLLYLTAHFAPAGASTGDSATSFSGRGTAVSATLLGTTTTLADTGPLPSSGGAEQASLLTATVPGTLTADVLHATTVGIGSRSSSEASLADLSLNAAGNSVTADFLMSRATAMCSSGQASASGSSEIAALAVNGQSVVVSTAPNQHIALPGGGNIAINEQQISQNGNSASVTVNALHVVIPGVADIVVASAHSDISCQGQSGCTSANDFVTGGGWITGTPSSARANFGVGGGTKNGSLWGHLVYIDHGPGGPTVKGTGVTAYSVTNATTRHIEGTAEVNGKGGFTYSIDVADYGEPGVNNDTFALKLSNGYSASGPLQGGNIEIHKPCA